MTAAYRAALEMRAPEQIVLFGGSAGANLALAALFQAHEEGLPMPAELVLLHCPTSPSPATPTARTAGSTLC